MYQIININGSYVIQENNKLLTYSDNNEVMFFDNSNDAKKYLEGISGKKIMDNIRVKTKSDIVHTVAYGRFIEFLDKINKANTDLDILKAGYDLVEKYRGFHYEWHSIAVEKLLPCIIYFRFKDSYRKQAKENIVKILQELPEYDHYEEDTLYSLVETIINEYEYQNFKGEIK